MAKFYDMDVLLELLAECDEAFELAGLKGTYAGWLDREEVRDDVIPRVDDPEAQESLAYSLGKFEGAACALGLTRLELVWELADERRRRSNPADALRRIAAPRKVEDVEL